MLPNRQAFGYVESAAHRPLAAVVTSWSRGLVAFHLVDSSGSLVQGSAAVTSMTSVNVRTGSRFRDGDVCIPHIGGGGDPVAGFGLACGAVGRGLRGSSCTIRVKQSSAAGGVLTGSRSVVPLVDVPLVVEVIPATPEVTIEL